MKEFVIVLSTLLFVACSAPPQTSSTDEPIAQNYPVVSDEPAEPAVSEGPELPPGSNEMLRAPLSMTDDDLEVIISDVIIPPNAMTPRHYHPGEEFVYIIEGSVVHVEEGKPEFILRAGDTVTLSLEIEHEPRATEEGSRVIAFRVHPEGTPERVLVEEEYGEE